VINKVASSVAQSLPTLADGACVLVGGFGTAGIPAELIDGLIAQLNDLGVRGARELVVVNNNAGNGETGLAALLKTGRVRKIVCSFPRQADSQVFDALYRSKQIELELVPQGNLAERIRAAGAGIGAFFSPTAFGTDLAKNPDGSAREVREINGRMHVLEFPIHGDLALIKAERGDRMGNLTYRKAARNFGPVMATAAKHTTASVFEVVEAGALDPEHIVTPGIFVKSLVCISRVATQAGGFHKTA
jgi:3-oxoadipate CoA-transferase, alpha subunit